MKSSLINEKNDFFGRSGTGLWANTVMHYGLLIKNNKKGLQCRNSPYYIANCKYNTHTGASPKNVNIVKKFSCILFQKVKLSYILDSLHVKHIKKKFVLILMISLQLMEVKHILSKY